jgi:hypothetical protein
MVRKSNDTPTEFVIPESWLVPKVKEGLLSDKKITVFYGWRDGGKSTSCVKILILKCLFDERFRCAHVRQHYNELSGTTFQQIKDVVEELGLTNKFIITKDGFKIINKARPSNYFFGASGDQPDKIRSTPNVTHVFWDEFHDATKDTFGSVLGTIREKEGIKTKFIAIFNNDKVAPEGFIDKAFFKTDSEDIETILIQHVNNPFIDQEQTRKKLLLVCLGNENEYDSLTSGKFVEEKGENPFAMHFKESIMSGDVRMRADERVIISIDFNNSPFCLSFCHVKREGGKILIDFFDSWSLKKCSVPEVIEKLKADPIYGPKLSNCYVTGDYSGTHGNTAYKDNRSHFDGIRTELRLLQQQMKLRPNPRHFKSRDDCSHIMYHSDVFIIRIDKVRCKLLIRDLNMVQYNEEKKQIIKTNRSDDNQQADLLDTFRSVVDNFLAEDIVRHKRHGRL